uniref:Deacetylase sirtuin-type domain-containing protein n=1 Tax=Graphocephala atropunctata TaxID=36148 RepID=A0A1B6L3P3_9HEMI
MFGLKLYTTVWDYLFAFNIFLNVLIQTATSTKLYDPPSNDVEKFRSLLKEAKNIVAITGAGVSGVPTYSSAWGLWRNFEGSDLDNEYTFDNIPFLIWEFTHYRREMVLKTGPNPAQKALADYERHLREEGKGRNVTVITLNTDGLHSLAGSQHVIEMCGSLFKTKCVKCGDVRENWQQPIIPSLAGKGDPSAQLDYVQADEEAVPHCSKPDCGGRLRPYVLFTGEDFPKLVVDRAEDALRLADLCLVVGTSSTVKPVSEFGPSLAGRGVPVAEFNIVNTDATMFFPFQFKGNCTQTLPQILKH